MEIGEPVSVPAPKLAPKAPPKSTFEGVIEGSAGPLEDWPFLLKKNGKAIDESGLSGGSSTNSYRDGAWVSGANGEFKFTNMPEGRYTIEVVVAVGKRLDNEPPDGSEESGVRAPLSQVFDRAAFSESPDAREDEE